MSRFTFKNIDSKQSTVKKYTAHKSWTITDETAPDYGVAVYSGSYGSSSFDSIKHIYYADPKNYHKSGDNQFLNEQYRCLKENVEIWSIPVNIFGDKLKPGSLTIQGSSKTYKDDGYGNLYCTVNYSNGDNWPPAPKDTLLHINFDSNVDSAKGTVINDDGVQIEQANSRLTRIFSRNTYIDSGRRTNGRSLAFTGTSSFASESNCYLEVIDSTTDRWNSDFAIHTWVKIPSSQKVDKSFIGVFNESGKRLLQDITHNVIASTRFNENIIPWEIGITNSNHSSGSGKIIALRGKDSNISEILSSGTYNSHNNVHIVFQKTGNNIQLYVGSGSDSSGTITGLNTTGSLVTAVDPITDENVNSSNVSLGGNKSGFMERALSNTDTQQYINERIIRPFSGSVDEFVIYDQALTTNQINTLYKYSTSHIVGNVFYNNGFAVISDTRNGLEGDDYTLTFKGSQDVETHKFRCTIEDGEYNMTLNATARQTYSITNPYPRGFVTSSDFTPYITVIGLYNSNNELLAIGKLAQPIKSPKDFDISIDVQFDI
tara:strand:+ start:736 stop:2367 length:1632 start_codon:yes stop_codon:yes gene_type:complete